eukprot:TRINITY_DN3842_c0_g1_i1.p1 TRINITY_DN3842_c0_g1~~TRINITY_DN3842_c0_g1_i1.p1  ORF type:complete len:190 (-),score=59.83 TRINITY_DN3842_c0_g1_i1:13-582(-)
MATLEDKNKKKNNEVQIIVVMGVSGTGKTTIGELLSNETNWHFEDADSFHTQENKDKMSKGIALTDEDRKPWLKAMSDHMYESWRENKTEGHIYACSCLKKKYRRALMEEGKKEEEDILPIDFVHLKGSYEVIEGRLSGRKGHFFDPCLLKSQFDTLEDLQPDERGYTVDITHSPEEIVQQILSHIHKN